MLRLRGGGDLSRVVVTCDVLTATPCRADLVFDIDRYPQLQHVLDRVHSLGWRETETGPQISDWRWACPLHTRSFESYMAAYSRTPIRCPDPRLSAITPPPAHTAIESSYGGVSSTPSFAQGFVRGHDWAHPILAHPGYRSTDDHQDPPPLTEAISGAAKTGQKTATEDSAAVARPGRILD